MNALEALLRGAGQGATASWGDEGSSKLLDLLPDPKDPEGYDREYKAGSAEQDHLNSLRGDNSSAQAAFPRSYVAGEVAGALPSTLAVPAGGGGSALARVAAQGLAGGVRGALSGAGGAEEGSRIQGGARGAATGAALGAGGAAVAEAAPSVISAFRNMPPPSGLTPAYATAGGAAPRAVAPKTLPNFGGVQINQERTLMPPPSDGSPSPEIPRAGRTGFSDPAELANVDNVISADEKLQGATLKRLAEKKPRDMIGSLPRDEGATVPAPANDAPTVQPMPNAISPGRPSGNWDMPSIPKSPKVPFTESQVPTADRYAESADVLHGDKVLGRAYKPDDVAQYQRLAKELEGGPKKLANDAASSSKTVRPAKKKR